MRFAIWTLLVIIPMFYGNCIEDTENENQTTAFFYDDELLKTIVSQLKALQEDNVRLQEGIVKLKETNVELSEKIDSMSTKAEALPMGPKRLPANCAEALLQSVQQSGIHRIQIPDTDLSPFYVFCLADPVDCADRAWTLIQRRLNGHIDFFLPWQEYQRGFGNLNSEFFLGLEKIHALTESALHELWIQMEDFDMVWRNANYSSFAIGSLEESYALKILGQYTGTAGDSLYHHEGMKFSTRDRDNDKDPKNCAVLYTGAWWYNSCHYSNLNGKYLRGAYGKDKFAQGVVWKTWHDYNYSLKYVHMAIRPVK